VDEFQDVDEVQYEIVRMLTGEDTKLCVVGDPDQTIYTWRGAQVDIILNFEKDFPNARTVILNENYRSNPAILHAANALISNNKDRIEKDLFTRNTQSVAIETHETPDSQQEPFQAVRFIRKAKEKGIPYKDMAILYRSNYLSRSFERILAKLNIPHRIYGGVRFYERQEIKDILCYLRLIAKPDPDDPEQKSLNLAAARVLNVPKRGIGAKSLENLNQEAAQSDKNLMEVLRQPTSVSAAVAKKLQPFVQLIDELKMLDLPLDQLAQEVINRTGYAAMLAENKEEERKENLSELVQDIRESMKDNPELTLEEYLQDVTLFTDREEEAENAVSLMTVHASKGLEFPAVMIVGLNEGVFPNNRAVEENGRQGLEEERRLLYVAMTRAKQYLYLSWNLGYSAMQQAYARPSRFLMEIPEEDIEHSKDGNNVKAVNPTTHKVHTVTRVQRLRPGDHVEHTLFGEGVVIKVEGGIASIAFAHKFGLKQLKADHPAIHKL
jgi:DNA helicase-2/ATP-dependent DNA helicase PcrA